MGLLAAAATAFYPELLWYPAHYWSETVYLLLLWGAIERTLAADARASRGTAAVAGLLWGLATLTRELSLYLVPIAALWMLRPRVAAGGALRARAIRDLTPGVGRAAVLVLATVLTVAPWTIRNAIVLRAFIPVSTMGGLNLWQGNTTLTHLEIYEVLATKGGAVEQDRFCRQMARETIAARQPAWIFEKLAEQMPEFWKAGSEVLDHLVGQAGLRPAAGRRARAGRARPGPAVPRWRSASSWSASSGSASPAPRGCSCSSSPPTTPPTSSRTPPRASGSRSCRSSSWWRRPWSSGRREGTLVPLGRAGAGASPLLVALVARDPRARAPRAGLAASSSRVARLRAAVGSPRRAAHPRTR